MHVWLLNGLVVAALLGGASACGRDTSPASPARALQVAGLPEKVGSYQRSDEPDLRQLEVREIGDGRGFALPGVCDGSKELRARAEEGHGTARRDVGWYSRGQIDVGVVRFDWSDEATFGAYADAFQGDWRCLDGKPDRSVELLGSSVPVWTPGASSDDASAGANLKITLDGTILSVSCDRGTVADCGDFATELIRALE